VTPSSDEPALDPGVGIGHVHLKVSDLDRSIAFYRDVLGFALRARMGDDAAFLAAGDYHHHIGLNTFESRGGSAPAPGTTGLYHAAIRFPTRRALARALRRLRAHGVALTGATDHGGTESLYLLDPDGIGLELYWDRPLDAWPRTPDGEPALLNTPLDIEGLIAAEHGG
jgi:catechol 2,3-dioxygenase